ncbi:MAG: nucleoside hydrolase [Clostridia bacterium]|nr:nucleoside hydrolase [Clostridia bacterium]
MRIGIDIDNCISNFDDTLLKEYLKHDKELRNTGIINENPEYLRKGMFDWTEEEERNFYNANIENFAKKLKPLEDSSYYIKKLKEDGHEIYIITGRNNGEYTNPNELTKEWLNKYDIVYDKLIFTNAYDKHAKTEICLENNIDLMIEDSTRISFDLINSGIKVYTMNTRYNQKEQTVDRVSKWKEIYEGISKLNKREDNKKVNVILDTDIYNECDDQFALSYLLKSQDKCNIEAITVAPYHHDNNISIEEGTDKSYDEIIKICNWLNFDWDNKVFKGSTDYVANDYNEKNDAVNKIIEIANKNDKTYILAIGAITNVAIAIKEEPKIIDKIEVIWLGGNSFLSKDNKEFNFK